MIQQIKNEIKKMNKEYNEQCNLIDELQSERKILQKSIAILKNDKLNDKYIIRTLKEKLKILETTQNRTRNVRKFITSSFKSSTADQKMMADINAFDQFEDETINRHLEFDNLYRRQSEISALIIDYAEQTRSECRLILNRTNDDDICKHLT
jgi:GDP-D-mannose dehydratase